MSSSTPVATSRTPRLVKSDPHQPRTTITPTLHQPQPVNPTSRKEALEFVGGILFFSLVCAAPALGSILTETIL
jgi:hypothetical protein